MSRRINWHTVAIMLAALALRGLVWWTLPYHDWVSDEAEYWGAATWLAQGRGFAFYDGWVWMRPPLYVLFLAVHIRLFGPGATWAPRLTQSLLSVVLVYAVMLLARRLAPPQHARRVGYLAGWAMALSYSFATFGYLLLNETLFLLFFVAGLLCLIGHRTPTPDSRLPKPDAHSLSFRAYRPSPIAYRTILAGLLFGLAALTKAIILTWLPFAALWLVVQARRDRSSRFGLRALVPALVLTVAVCAIVLPWTAYATARWGDGGLILVDTTGGYNFALGAQSGRPAGRDENELHGLLCPEHICDARQAQRQSSAYALGWRWIREYQTGFVAKTGRELLDMVQLRYGGAERLRSGHTVGAVPAVHLLGLLWDDTLYVVAVVLAMLGLLRHQGRAGKGLMISWLLYNVAVGALVFAINRFRQPLLPFIFIYAACAIVQWRESWPTVQRRALGWGLAGLIALLVLPSYLYWPPQLDATRRSVWQETLIGFAGLRNAAECRQIEAVLRSGDVARARQLHDAASVRQPRDCLALINAHLLEAEGKIDGSNGALAFLRRSSRTGNPQQDARIYMLEGDLLRRLGRTDEIEQRGVFYNRSVEQVNDLAWAWDNLQPPITTTLDIGGGLDYGSVRGFYQRDASSNTRWSGPGAMIRFVGAGTGAPQTLMLRIYGPQPISVTPRLNDQPLPAFALQTGWQEISILLPATPVGADVVVAFDSPLFVLGPQDLAERVRSPISQPLRLVGFQLDKAELK